MRWLLYGIAGVVALLLLAVVVLLGMSRDESRLAASVDIARPPDVVFTWISDAERVKRWLGWLVEIRPVSGDQAQAGARQIWVMEDRNNNNQRMEIDTEFVEYRKPHQLTARVSGVEGFTGTIVYALEPLDSGGTRLRYTGTYRFHHWLAQLMEPLITRSAQQKLEEDLARLKQQAEAEGDVARER